jgi:hypothetical protein
MVRLVRFQSAHTATLHLPDAAFYEKLISLTDSNARRAKLSAGAGAAGQTSTLAAA